MSKTSSDALIGSLRKQLQEAQEELEGYQDKAFQERTVSISQMQTEWQLRYP